MATARIFYDSFKQLLLMDKQFVASFGQSIPFPQFTPHQYYNLIEEFKECMKNQKGLVYHDSDCTVVGDIHGNIHDMCRVIMTNGIPPLTHYVFLGDYVDRGSYSIEVVSLLFAMCILFPDCVTAIRGNHEVISINEYYGFKETVMSSYADEKLYLEFNKAFEYLPLACIINHSYFCVHGGLSQKLTFAAELENFPLPITEINDMMNELLWSDPTEATCLFMDNKRGNGIVFGRPATKAFLKRNKLLKVIRGHQTAPDGVEKAHRGLVFTVFSSSYYESPSDLCGFLNVQQNVLIPGCLSPIRYIPRCQAQFKNVDPNEYKISQKKFNSFRQIMMPQKSTSYHQRINPSFCGKRRSSLANVQPLKTQVIKPRPTSKVETFQQPD